MHLTIVLASRNVSRTKGRHPNFTFQSCARCTKLGVSDTTFEGKIWQPKLGWRPLSITKSRQQLPMYSLCDVCLLAQEGLWQIFPTFEVTGFKHSSQGHIWCFDEAPTRIHCPLVKADTMKIPVTISQDNTFRFRPRPGLCPLGVNKTLDNHWERVWNPWETALFCIPAFSSESDSEAPILARSGPHLAQFERPKLFQLFLPGDKFCYLQLLLFHSFSSIM